MPYQAELGQGQRVTIDNQGEQTVITIATYSAGQQQSQQMSVALGKWTTPPILFKTPTGLILQIESAQQRSWVRLHANSVSLLGACPPMVGAQAIPLQQVGALFEMPKMQPMQPIQMGNMEMQMQPMEMRMGNLHLSMNSSQARSPVGELASQSAASDNSSRAIQFCSQCGTKVKPDDRFCFNCGTKLKS